MVQVYTKGVGVQKSHVHNNNILYMRILYRIAIEYRVKFTRSILHSVVLDGNNEIKDHNIIA